MLNTGSCICCPNGLTATPQQLCNNGCQFSMFDLTVSPLTSFMSEIAGTCLWHVYRFVWGVQWIFV